MQLSEVEALLRRHRTVTALAAQFTDETVAFNGAVSFIPVVALQLARATHAPDLVWAASSIALDARPVRLGASTLDSGIWGGAAMLENSPYDFWSYAQGARFISFLSGVLSDIRRLVL